MASTTVPTTPARPFVYADLEDIADDGYQREIIGGALIVNPAPVGRHQQASATMLGSLRQAAPADLLVLAAPYDWRLPDGGSVQPDLMVVRRDDFDPDGPFPAGANPLLVVEILSPSNADQDRILKRAIYQRLMVQAYWIVDPGSATRAPSLTALQLEEDVYVVEAEIAGPACFESDWPFPMRFTPNDLTA